MSNIGGKQELIMQRSIIFVILFIGSLVYLMPFLWMVRSSLMGAGQIFKMPLEWIPKPFKWDNYGQALTAMPFARYFLNTVLIVVLVEAGTLLTAPMAAFAFSRLRWRGRDTLFFILLTSLMIPYAVTLIPIFILWTKLGAINTYLPLTVPAWFGGSAYYIFLLRQFFAGLPIEYDEAAYLDGATPWQILWKIVIPLSKPAMITVAVFTFLGVWGDLMGPIIYLNDANKYTLAVGLTIFRGAYSTKWNLLMAASTVIMVPPIVLYFLGQRYFEQGITMGGIK